MTDEIGDYKARVIPEMRATLEWQRDLLFTATTRRGYDIDFDAEVQWGCMPTEGLLLSLAGCIAIDVVSILRKMRCPPPVSPWTSPPNVARLRRNGSPRST